MHLLLHDDGAYLLPTPRSLMLRWKFEMSHGGSIYTGETSKCYKSWLYPPRGLVVKHLLGYHGQDHITEPLNNV